MGNHMSILSNCKKEIGRGDAVWHKLVDAHGSKVDVGGYSLKVIDMGTGQAVVMIHGFGDSAYCYHKNLRALLDAGFRVILVEQPGLGQSDIPPQPYTYSVENQAEAISTALDCLGIDRFPIVGHSMGGGIALYLAFYYPQRIEKTVCIDGACYPLEGMRLFANPVALSLGKFIVRPWIIRMALNDVFYDKSKVTDAMVAEYAKPLNKPGYMNALAGLAESFFSEKFMAMTQRYASLSPPLHIFWGEHDKWLPPEFGRRLAATVGGSRLHMMKEAGHSPHQERPEAFNALLVSALRKR